MLQIGKYSIGVGDRFGRQGRAQLAALLMARERGVSVVPVWNKSHREHTLVGSEPASVRREADEATAALGWGAPYHVDADHIGLATVDPFIETHDFFTLDVADFLGRPAGPGEVEDFVARHRTLTRPLAVAGLDEPLCLAPGELGKVARFVLPAVREAGRIHRRIAAGRGEGSFVTERRASRSRPSPPGSPASSPRGWITKATWGASRGSSIGTCA
jgi:hypothetical protein